MPLSSQNMPAFAKPYYAPAHRLSTNLDEFAFSDFISLTSTKPNLDLIEPFNVISAKTLAKAMNCKQWLVIEDNRPAKMEGALISFSAAIEAILTYS
jgi:hypothetical protein